MHRSSAQSTPPVSTIIDVAIPTPSARGRKSAQDNLRSLLAVGATFVSNTVAGFARARAVHEVHRIVVVRKQDTSPHDGPVGASGTDAIAQIETSQTDTCENQTKTSNKCLQQDEP